MLVTGAGGFLGRNVVERLLAEGTHVIALVRGGGARPWPAGVEPVVCDLARPWSPDLLPRSVDAPSATSRRT